MEVNACSPLSPSTNCSELPLVCDEVMGERGGEAWELPYLTFHLLYGPSRVAQATAKLVQESSFHLPCLPFCLICYKDMCPTS